MMTNDTDIMTTVIHCPVSGYDLAKSRSKRCDGTSEGAMVPEPHAARYTPPPRHTLTLHTLRVF